ncbi:FkbM family methyltransferase [Candidatus Accumulibacter sp. ACC003]|uniref:FkbM family methyltransferase n=1 Tax=Candidatus Accumulibacter sp. ACC003 TaxID=2823334 RepID=UPI0025BF4D4B|nr:FkbM family methyltransferase [Candidatus Accumulibacter sp. ACC003]
MLFSDLDLTHLRAAINDIHEKKLVLWGAGRRLKGFIEEFCGESKLLPKPLCVCDSTRDIPEKELFGIPVMSFSEVRNMSPQDTVIIMTAGLLELQAKVVSNELYYFPIYHCRSFEAYSYLQENMADCDRCIDLLADQRSKEVYRKRIENILFGQLWDQSLYSANPYFGNEINEVLDDSGQLVFAGAFNGKHIERAILNNPAIRVTAFEPSTSWSRFLAEKFKNNPRITINNKILWSENRFLAFDDDDSNAGLDAHVCGDAALTKHKREAVAIDEYVDGKVSMIALDVEGSEQLALKGASETIARDHPKLCICLYHTLDDYFRIPLLISENSDYQLRVKHHSCISVIETVLYTV